MRVYMWIPEGGSNCRTRHTMPEGCHTRPWRIWTMYRHDDPKTPPSGDIHLQHGLSGFLEDFVHDWNYDENLPNEIRYYSRVTEGGVWIALEYKGSEPDSIPCSSCSHMHPHTARFCSQCGKRLRK